MLVAEGAMHDRNTTIIPYRRERSLPSFMTVFAVCLAASVIAWNLPVDLSWMPGTVAKLIPPPETARAPEIALDETQATPSVSHSFTLCGDGPRINCVVDGDTFWLDGVKIRIADIDAPEIHPSRCDREEQLGQAAKLRLLDLLNAGGFALRSGDRDHDRYGRALRDVTRGGASLGETLVREGLARTWEGHRRSWCD
jgi:endonuclease YncB( thermonuclease family)